ncbi:uncharacterized protein BO88DRAFT_449433 [Aspergillus vadensis CBS 113365]|uniref:Uncharacterized protein n=1 Tax=Aspergillus vadensis (strain CBS 113365 / IMI 142717 / IBT 24658) TaxID=1448311 RepID=A0A319D091_ASPVC|nr:hypothetical protein BO88DRAFT_449433 [Aspergillus vadensis CBS 113365]PYH73562.1 hypothetical protein BO88DRAFT_449433 [Aspergillus vadensis CBS 113365]
MSFVPCSWDAYMDNYGSCFKPCYSGYLSQILDNGTCGTNYTTIAASTSKSTLKCICENAHGVSDTWSKTAWECSYTRCDNLTGNFNYSDWISSIWSYDDLCAIRKVHISSNKIVYGRGSGRIIGIESGVDIRL